MVVPYYRGILFMNYLYYSKHLHIIFAFPNTWFANLQKKGKFNNLASVTKEIKLMMDQMRTHMQQHLPMQIQMQFLINLEQMMYSTLIKYNCLMPIRVQNVVAVQLFVRLILRVKALSTPYYDGNERQIGGSW